MATRHMEQFLTWQDLAQKNMSLTQWRHQDACKTTRMMLLAVNYLHSCGVVHRDLKLGQLPLVAIISFVISAGCKRTPSGFGWLCVRLLCATLMLHEGIHCGHQIFAHKLSQPQWKSLNIHLLILFATAMATFTKWSHDVTDVGPWSLRRIVQTICVILLASFTKEARKLPVWEQKLRLLETHRLWLQQSLGQKHQDGAQLWDFILRSSRSLGKVLYKSMWSMEPGSHCFHPSCFSSEPWTVTAWPFVPTISCLTWELQTSRQEGRLGFI
jgi:hypothetical protein